MLLLSRECGNYAETATRAPSGLFEKMPAIVTFPPWKSSTSPDLWPRRVVPSGPLIRNLPFSRLSSSPTHWQTQDGGRSAQSNSRCTTEPSTTRSSRHGGMVSIVLPMTLRNRLRSRTQTRRCSSERSSSSLSSCVSLSIALSALMRALSSSTCLSHLAIRRGSRSSSPGITATTLFAKVACARANKACSLFTIISLSLSRGL